MKKLIITLVCSLMVIALSFYLVGWKITLIVFLWQLMHNMEKHWI